MHLEEKQLQAAPPRNVCELSWSGKAAGGSWPAAAAALTGMSPVPCCRPGPSSPCHLNLGTEPMMPKGADIGGAGGNCWPINPPVGKKFHFKIMAPNFCDSKKLLKKLGVGVGRKWIELSL